MATSSTNDAPKKVKIDLDYLWEKYGNRKKRKPKPKVEEPIYHQEGFSVKFKLSHAYKALEKQEQDVAEPVMETKKVLTPKMVKQLAAKSKSVKPPQCEESGHFVIDRGSLKERVQTDLSKYKEMGKLKREQTETMLKVAREKENIPQSSPKKKTDVRCKSADFWSSLSMRKGIQKDDMLSQTSEYEDRTFLTNLNISSALKSSKSVPNKGKHVKIRLDVSDSPRQALPSQTKKVHVQVKDSGKPKARVATKAVLEWDRRNKQRQVKNLDQKCKIREAAKFNHQTIFPDSSSSGGGHRTSKSPSTKRKNRPKSAPSPSRDTIPSESKATPLYKTIKHKKVSQWSKSLDSMYLDVPSDFEERETTKKPEKESNKAKDNDANDEGEQSQNEEEEEEEPQLKYKPSEFLYGMCNCRNIAKQTTLSKLKKKTKTAGVIQIFGCPSEEQKSSTSCPFCSEFPRRRIQAWLDDVEKNTDPFWTALHLS